MGRESRLKNAKPESRYEYRNGQRKIFNRDSMPQGLDSDVWDLVLYFEQLAEENQVATPGRPVMYSELYYRISKDPELSQLLPSDTSLTARTRGTTDIDSTDDTLDTLRRMIDMYWDSYYYNDSNNQQQPINDFISVVVFNYLKKYVVDTKKRNNLITTGIRKPQPEREKKPSRKTEEEKETYRIVTKTYTEDEIKEKFARWKKEHP